MGVGEGRSCVDSRYLALLPYSPLAAVGSQHDGCPSVPGDESERYSVLLYSRLILCSIVYS